MITKNRENIIGYLNDYPVNRLFSFDIMPFIELHTYIKGEYICKETEPQTHLYFLISGNVKIFMTLKNGKINIVELLSGSGIIGELEMLKVQSETQAVQAISNVVCFALPLDCCRNLILNDAYFLRELCIILGKKMRKNSSIFTVNQSYPLENRLASYILLIANDGVFDQRLTEVSEYIGTSYRHLLRTMSRFCEKNILERKKYGYIIVDEEKLRRLSSEII